MSFEEEIPQKVGVESVKRAFSILRCFSLDRPELGVTQISRELGVHKSTVSRLISTLESERIVIRNPKAGRYRLGVGLLELSGLVTLHADLRRITHPFMVQLAQLTQETVNLAALESDEVVNIEHITSFWTGNDPIIIDGAVGVSNFALLVDDRLRWCQSKLTLTGLRERSPRKLEGLRS